MSEEEKAAITEYTPTYETGKNEVTMATATAITFENLPYGYYLVIPPNDYDDPVGGTRKSLCTMAPTMMILGLVQGLRLTKDSTEAEIATAPENTRRPSIPIWMLLRLMLMPMAPFSRKPGTT